MNIHNSTPLERESYLKQQARSLLIKRETRKLTAACEHCGRVTYKTNMHPKDEYGETVYYCNGCVNIK